jgi:DNA replication protein DnaC
VKTLDDFDFTAADGVSAPKIAQLARGEWITRGENVLFAGPIGMGKTHLAIALGYARIRRSLRQLENRVKHPWSRNDEPRAA